MQQSRESIFNNKSICRERRGTIPVSAFGIKTKNVSMQRDFWTLHSNASKGRRFVFVWDKRYDVGLVRLEHSIRAMRPSVVVFGSAVWFVWSGLRDFHGYRKALAELLLKLRTLAERLLSHYLNVFSTRVTREHTYALSGTPLRLCWLSSRTFYFRITACARGTSTT